MKRFLSLVISLSILISLCPVITLGADAVLGTKDNPIVIDTDNPYAFYEAESYPVVNSSSSNYSVVNDTDASGAKAIKQSKSIGYTELSTKGDKAQYRLWIKAANEGKIKVFLRLKLNKSSSWADATTTKITCAKNDDPLLERTHYIEEQGKYYWVCSDSYEVSAGEEFSFSLILSSARNNIDKFFITSDLQAFPKNLDEVSDLIDFSYCKDYYNAPLYNPINSHPRILVNSGSIGKIKANLTKEENISAYNGLITKADTVPSSNKFQNSVNYILSNAFLSVVGDEAEKEQRALNAKNTLLESLKLKSSLPTDRSSKENMNKVIYRLFTLAIVYDWCYDYLTQEEKDIIVSNMMFYMAEQEYTYPPLAISGVNNGHESEGDIFVGMLSCAIAIFDEYPDMYRTVGGKIFEQMLPARNYYYEMGNHTQGTHYNGTRMIHELYFSTLLQSGIKDGLIKEGADQIIMEYIYGLRPDNRIMRNGDHDASGTSYGLSTNSATLFYYANYYNNPYLKNEYLRVKPTPVFSTSLTSVNEVMWLIFNNPDLKPKDYSELPYTYFTGDKGGVMFARTSWDQGDNAMSNAMAVRMNLETIFGAGHDHLDAGHFDIYYKGSLALDSGFYTGVSSNHHQNYYQRTIAHNSMLLYDENEDMTQRYDGAVNDGGQRFRLSGGGTADTLYERQKIGEILAVDYGEDMYNPSFAYMKGDLTDAYNPDKMENYTRSFVFLNFFDEVYPGALIVFDKITSKNPDFKKTWLLHTQEEPTINGNTVIAGKSEEGDNGRLINTTLLPKSTDADIQKVGGYDMRFSTNGTNYQYNISSHAKDYGEWRVELSPKTKKATDTFLNVIQVSENDDSIEPLKPELIETTDGNFKGVKIKNRIVLFNNSDTVPDRIMFTFQGSGEYEVLITGVSSGKWNIQSNTSINGTSAIATENGSDLYFKGAAGTYALRKDTVSSASLTRDLDYKKYIRESDEEYSYIKFNDVYHSASFFEENGKLYVDAEYISKYLDSPLEYTDDGLKYFNDIYSVEVLKDSEDVILKDGVYYVSPDAFSEIFFVDWVKENDYIYNLTISKRTITKITTGEEFSDCAFANQKALYIIEGTDKLPDGTEGIKLPSTYTSKSNVAGVIKGIDNKNNICLTSQKSLFSKSDKTGYIAFINLNLKGENGDGSGTIIPDGKSCGVLLTEVYNYSNYQNNVLIFKDISNYLDIKYPDAYKYSTCYAGGLIGYIQYKDTYVDGCVNYGNIDATYGNSGTAETRSAGFVASTRYGKTTITNSENRGNISINNGPAGGLHGFAYGADSIVNISQCANYGNVTSNLSNNSGGLLGNSNGGMIEKSFNIGNVSGLNGAGGLLGKATSGTITISDSFNAGNVSMTTPAYGHYASGIASKSGGTLNIINCYNIGVVSNSSYSREISNSVNNSSGCYYINSDANSSVNKAGTFIDCEEFATYLPSEFSPQVWEYTAVTDENKYSYPQLIGNNVVTTLDKFYSPKVPVTISGGYDIFKGEPNEEVRDTFTGELILTPYVIVPAKFSFLKEIDIEGVEYGIFISKTVSGRDLTEKTCERIARGIKNVLGNFGILIYGNKLIKGDTYYVRPYVKYNEKYYYGATDSFIFGE